MFNRLLNAAFIATAFTLFAGWASAAPRKPTCSIVVINGDTVISCPKLVVRGGK